MRKLTNIEKEITYILNKTYGYEYKYQVDRNYKCVRKIYEEILKAGYRVK